MAGEIKKQSFADGADVTAPSDLGLATSTSSLKAYPDDATYVSNHGAAANGSVYINTSSGVRTLRLYVNSAWRNVWAETDPGDATKLIVKDLSGQTTGVTLTIASVITTNRTWTVPDFASTFVGTTGTQTISGTKTHTAAKLDSAVISGATKQLDVDAAANLAIGASVGANNLTVGGSSTTVVIPGNLQVNGTTTDVETTNMQVKDKNIDVNFGGNDASSEGAGITVKRTGNSGSIIYAAAAASRFKIGDATAEREIADISSSQIFTSKTIDGDDNTIQDLGLTTLKTVLGDANKEIRRNSTGVVVAGPVTQSDAGAVAGMTQLDVDNVRLDGNTISTTDTNGNLLLVPNGAGTTKSTKAIQSDAGFVMTETGGGTDTVTHKAPSAVTSSYNIVWPGTQGGSGTVPSNDGSGNLSWVSMGGGGTSFDAPYDAKNYSLVVSLAANAMTVALKSKAGTDPAASDEVYLSFRNATLATGNYTTVAVAAATSLTVASGATLGQTSGRVAYYYVYALNNAGTVELAIIGQSVLDEQVVQSSTALSGSSNSAYSLYSTTARSNVPVRYLGRVRNTQTTAGTWAQAMTEISINKAGTIGVFGDPALAAPAPMIRTAIKTLTVTGTNWSTTRAEGIFYFDNAGNWRLTFNIRGTVSGGTTGGTITITGVTFVEVQAVCGNGNSSNWIQCQTGSGDGTISLLAGTSTSAWRISGDVTLSGVPNP